MRTAGGAVAPGSKETGEGREEGVGEAGRRERGGQGEGSSCSLPTLQAISSDGPGTRPYSAAEPRHLWGYTVELYPHCLTMSSCPSSLPISQSILPCPSSYTPPGSPVRVSSQVPAPPSHPSCGLACAVYYCCAPPFQIAPPLLAWVLFSCCTL